MGWQRAFAAVKLYANISSSPATVLISWGTVENPFLHRPQMEPMGNMNSNWG